MLKCKPETRLKSDLDYLKRDPEEEFFMLAVLALKMVHNEEFDDSEYVYEISAGKLFREVRGEKLQFHRWYKWLEQRFKEFRQAYLRERGDSESDLHKWQQDDPATIEAIKKNKKKSIFDRISRFISKNVGTEKEMKRKLSHSGDRFNNIQEPVIKRRGTFRDVLAGKGEF